MYVGIYDDRSVCEISLVCRVYYVQNLPIMHIYAFQDCTNFVPILAMIDFMQLHSQLS